MENDSKNQHKQKAKQAIIQHKQERNTIFLSTKIVNILQQKTAQNKLSAISGTFLLLYGKN
ncbi:MAG: hypothetical protein EOM31_08330 [Bacteroidia bacterium]|nr:hypothetical protein [Bacteroidia bacterium]